MKIKDLYALKKECTDENMLEKFNDYKDTISDLNSEFVKQQVDNGEIFKFVNCKVNSIYFEYFNDFNAKRFILSIHDQYLEVEKNVFIDLYISYCEREIDKLIRGNRMYERDGEKLHRLIKTMVKLSKNEKV